MNGVPRVSGWPLAVSRVRLGLWSQDGQGELGIWPGLGETGVGGSLSEKISL